jgi:hypothetical protein
MKANSPLASRAILIADAGVEDLAILLDGIDEGVTPWLVRPGEDAIDVVAAALRTPGLKALHLLAHGAPGQIRLGGRDWSADDFGARLHTGARRDLDIAFWSCRTGAGAEGLRFVQTVAMATGARVAAPQGLVGDARRGGSWQAHGAVGAPFSERARDRFAHTLPSGAIFDTTANIEAQMAALIADASQILQVMSSDIDPSVLTYAVNGTEGAGLQQLLGLFAQNPMMQIVLTGTVTQLEAAYASGLNGLDALAGMLPVMVTPTDASVRDFLDHATLSAEFGAALQPIATVTDTAASIEAFLPDLMAAAALPGFRIVTTDTTPTSLNININGLDSVLLGQLLGSALTPSPNVFLDITGLGASLKAGFDNGLSALTGITGARGVEITATSVAAADLPVLVSQYGRMLTPSAVIDTVGNVQANLSGLLGNVDRIQSINMSGAGTLTYTVKGSDGAALQALFGEITPAADQHIALFGKADSLLQAFQQGLTGLGGLGGFAGVTVTTVGVVSAGDASTLASEYGTLLHASTLTGDVSASANLLQGNFAELIANIDQVSSITLTDTSSTDLLIALDGSEGAALNAIFGKMTPNFKVTVHLAGTAAALKADHDAGLAGVATMGGYANVFTVVTDSTISAADAVTLVGEYGATLHALTVADTAAHMGGALAALLPTLGLQVNHITLTDTRAATLSYEVNGLDGAALASLPGFLVPNAHVTLALSGSMGDLERDYVNGLNGLSGWSGFAAIRVTPNGPGLSVADVGRLHADFGALLHDLQVQDSASNIQLHLADLVAVGAQLSHLTLTDAGPATLTYTVNGADAAGLIGMLTTMTPNTNVALVLTGTAANLEADAFDGLGNVLSSVSKFPPLASMKVVVNEHVSVADATILSGAYAAQLAPLTVADTADHLATLSGSAWLIDPAVQAAGSVIVRGAIGDDELAALNAAHVNLVVDSPGLSAPNVFIIETASTPALTITYGMVAEIIDSASVGGHTFHLATGGKMVLSGSDGPNNIVFDGYNAGQLSVSHAGATAIFTDIATSRQVAAIATDAVHASAQTITYSDGSHVALTLIGSNLALDGVTISALGTVH